MRSVAKKLSFIITLSLISTININAQDGGAIFKAKCSACHSVGSTRLVGPGLAGINEKRSREWLLTWIKDSQAMIASGDADAIAIFEEYNKSPMIPFTDLSDDEIISILNYVDAENGGGEVTSTETKKEVKPTEPIAYSKEDVEIGEALYTGERRFKNGGPSCISCHNVTNDNLMVGGLLAKDLTNVYERLGDAGISGIVSAPPFPAMVNSYGNQPLTEDEVRQLSGFFKYVDKISQTQTQRKGFKLMAGGGILGLIIILGLVSILWSNRKNESTKKDIFSRQLKGNDSIES